VRVQNHGFTSDSIRFKKYYHWAFWSALTIVVDLILLPISLAFFIISPQRWWPLYIVLRYRPWAQKFSRKHKALLKRARQRVEWWKDAKDAKDAKAKQAGDGKVDEKKVNEKSATEKAKPTVHVNKNHIKSLSSDDIKRPEKGKVTADQPPPPPLSVRDLVELLSQLIRLGVWKDICRLLTNEEFSVILGDDQEISKTVNDINLDTDISTNAEDPNDAGVLGDLPCTSTGFVLQYYRIYSAQLFVIKENRAGSGRADRDRSTSGLTAITTNSAGGGGTRRSLH
jgi:hypothetical protein